MPPTTRQRHIQNSQRKQRTSEGKKMSSKTNGKPNNLIAVRPICDEKNELELGNSEKKLGQEHLSVISVLVTIITSITVGIIWGWMLQKSSVYKPTTIRNQFLLTDFAMLKMFLAAFASGQLVILLLMCIPKTRSKFEAAKQAFGECMTDKSVLASVVGSLLLGSGMAVAAACPGMVLTQVGSLVPNSAYTVCGGLLGCLVYGLVHAKLTAATAPKKPWRLYIYELLNVPYAALAIPCILLCFLAVALMEIYIPAFPREPTVPTNESTAHTHGSPNFFAQEMWYPSVCGVFVGLLQLPLVLTIADTLGSSTGYMVISSQWAVTKSIQKKFTYFAKFRNIKKSYWTLFVMAGMACGGLLGGVSSGTVLKSQGPIWWQAFLGGFLMLFGSRFAAGCTSGNGLSGTALLVLMSWISLPCIFGGGIGTAFIMKYTDTNLYTEFWEPIIN